MVDELNITNEISTSAGSPLFPLNSNVLSPKPYTPQRRRKYRYPSPPLALALALALLPAPLCPSLFLPGLCPCLLLGHLLLLGCLPLIPQLLLSLPVPQINPKGMAEETSSHRCGRLWPLTLWGHELDLRISSRSAEEREEEIERGGRITQEREIGTKTCHVISSQLKEDVTLTRKIGCEVVLQTASVRWKQEPLPTLHQDTRGGNDSHPPIL